MLILIYPVENICLTRHSSNKKVQNNLDLKKKKEIYNISISSRHTTLERRCMEVDRTSKR